MKWSKHASAIKAFIFDIDGVLTDGQLGLSPAGVFKSFDIKDGQAMKVAMNLGFQVGVLSGRDDEANRRRNEELHLSFYYGGENDKNAAFDRILQQRCLTAEACVYVGDDWIDIPVIRRAGIGVCVADADAEVKRFADWITVNCGGHGAAREVIVRVLKEQGRWEEAIVRFTK